MKLGFKKIDWLRFLQKKSILVLGVILILFILGFGFIIYEFYYKTIGIEPEIPPAKIRFKKELLEGFQADLQVREETLERINSRSYRNILGP